MSMYSQSKLPNDTIPAFDRSKIKYNEKLDNYLNLGQGETGQSNDFSSAATSVYRPLDKVENEVFDLVFPPLNIYTGPPVENNTFTRFPFANDYAFYSGMPISDNLWISTSSTQNGYPTLGAVRSVSMSLNYQPTNWLIISGGTFGAKYNLFGHNFNDTGLNGRVKFVLHDRVRINTFGQFSMNDNNRNIRAPYVGMYPHTYYGGSIELKITDKFGIEGGVIRELNPLNGKWENRPYIAPVFYGK